MTYTQVHAILSGDETARAEFAPLVPEFERMLTLAKILNRKREQRGSIDFDLPEPIIDFNDEGEMQGILRSDRTWANRLIEEFMLSANECVADWHERARRALDSTASTRSPTPSESLTLKKPRRTSATRSESARCR